MLLAIFRDNWADEINFEGARLFTPEEWDAYKAQVHKNGENGFEHYFGTNEYNEYNTPAEFLETITIKEISEMSANTLLHLFPNIQKYGFGEFPWPPEEF